VTERIKCSTVTDALIAATERADEMEHCIVLWTGKPGNKVSTGFFTDHDLTVETTLWMLESFKIWLLTVDKEG
jgi:hypothetical protein